MSGAEWLTLIQLVLAVGLAWLVLVLVNYCNGIHPTQRKPIHITVSTDDQAS